MSADQSIALLVTSVNLSRSEQVATLFMLAQSYLALDCDVEMYFAGMSVELLVRANAAQPIGYGTQRQSLQAHLERTVASGATIFSCTQALANLAVTQEELLPFARTAGGLVQFAARSIEPGWRGLVF